MIQSMELCLVQNLYLIYVNSISSLDTFTRNIIIIYGVIYVHIPNAHEMWAVSCSSYVSSI